MTVLAAFLLVTSLAGLLVLAALVAELVDPSPPPEDPPPEYVVPRHRFVGRVAVRPG